MCRNLVCGLSYKHLLGWSCWVSKHLGAAVLPLYYNHLVLFNNYNYRKLPEYKNYRNYGGYGKCQTRVTAGVVFLPKRIPGFISALV